MRRLDRNNEKPTCSCGSVYSRAALRISPVALRSPTEGTAIATGARIGLPRRGRARTPIKPGSPRFGLCLVETRALHAPFGVVHD